MSASVEQLVDQVAVDEAGKLGDGAMMFGAFTAASPEIVLLTLICVVLVADLFVDEERKVITFWLSNGVSC